MWHFIFVCVYILYVHTNTHMWVVFCCSHPLLILESYRSRLRGGGGGGGGTKSSKAGTKSKGKRAADDDDDDDIIRDDDEDHGASALADDELEAMAKLVEANSRPASSSAGSGFGRLKGVGGLQGSRPPVGLSSLVNRRSSGVGGTALSSSSSSAKAIDSYFVDPEQSGKLLVLHRLMQVRNLSDYTKPFFWLHDAI